MSGCVVMLIIMSLVFNLLFLPMVLGFAPTCVSHGLGITAIIRIVLMIPDFWAKYWLTTVPLKTHWFRL